MFQMAEEPPTHQIAPGDHANAPRRRWLPPLVLALVTLGLYVPGLGWGLPGVHSWSQDTVAGLRTTAALVDTPEHFHGRYPPLHYWINHALYRPFYIQWEQAGELVDDSQSGLRIPTPPLERKVGTLIFTSRCLSVAMAFLAGL